MFTYLIESNVKKKTFSVRNNLEIYTRNRVKYVNISYIFF